MKKDFLIGGLIGLALIIFPIVMLTDVKPCPATITLGGMKMAGCR